MSHLEQIHVNNDTGGHGETILHYEMATDYYYYKMATDYYYYKMATVLVLLLTTNY